MVVIGQNKDFLGKSAPPGYVAGLGRGAVGFTTRADIGPGRDVAAGENAAPTPADIERFQNNENEEGLLGAGPYDKEDEEADLIYAAIDAKMEERRKSRKEAREKRELESNNQAKPKVQEQFGDLKRDLASMSADDWLNIPEPGDMVAVGRKLKRARDNGREVFTAASDMLLHSATASTKMETSIGASSGGTETPNMDYQQMSQAKNDMIKTILDRAVSKDSASGKTTVDPRGYMTGLNSMVSQSTTEIGDIQRAAELLNSVTMTNPKHAPGWIAAARVDEISGKMSAARAKIAKGCKECPKNEDVWLEAARLNHPTTAKSILAEAIRELPRSVKIWVHAMNLETDVKVKKKVIRRALEYIPQSSSLWKAAVELEDDQDDARILLSRAVEEVPESIELWLALAKLETYDQAKKVLNKARKANAGSHEIWIAAAQLEDSAGNESNVEMIIGKAVQSLAAQGSRMSRSDWLREAERCEEAGAILTCQAIVRAALNIDVDDDTRVETWLEDAATAMAHDAVDTARTVYAELIKAYPDDESIWLKAAHMEKEKGTHQSLDELLAKAAEMMPDFEVFWLMRAKEKWMAGDIDGARSVLGDAFTANPDSEDVWLAAVKLETENGEYAKGRLLLEKARNTTMTGRVWMKSAVLERNLKRPDLALQLVNEAIQKFPQSDKLWLIKGQVEMEDMNDMDAARTSFAEGIKNCPTSVQLWIHASRLEEKAGNVTKSRALLDKARLKNPNNVDLWLESVRIELRAKNETLAKTLLSKALKECPTAGRLWAESIFLEQRPARKSRSVDAVKKCNDDADVLIVVGRLFWQERNIEKARSWLNRAVKVNLDFGDAWAWLYKFEREHGVGEQIKDVVDRCVAADPHHGEIWAACAKNPINFRMNTEDLLKLVASKLPQ